MWRQHAVVDLTKGMDQFRFVQTLVLVKMGILYCHDAVLQLPAKSRWLSNASFYHRLCSIFIQLRYDQEKRTFCTQLISHSRVLPLVLMPLRKHLKSRFANCGRT